MPLLPTVDITYSPCLVTTGDYIAAMPLRGGWCKPKQPLRIRHAEPGCAQLCLSRVEDVSQWMVLYYSAEGTHITDAAHKSRCILTVSIPKPLVVRPLAGSFARGSAVVAFGEDTGSTQKE